MRGFFALAVVLVGSVLGVLFYGPYVVRDWLVSERGFVAARDATLEEAGCNVHWAVLSTCTVAYRETGPGHERSYLRYVFLGSVVHERIALLRAREDRTVILADIGVRHLTNRFVTMVVLVSFACAAGYGVLRAGPATV